MVSTRSGIHTTPTRMAGEDEVHQQGSSNGGDDRTMTPDQPLLLEAIQGLQNTQQEILTTLQNLTHTMLVMSSNFAPAPNGNQTGGGVILAGAQNQIQGEVGPNQPMAHGNTATVTHAQTTVGGGSLPIPGLHGVPSQDPMVTRGVSSVMNGAPATVGVQENIRSVMAQKGALPVHNLVTPPVNVTQAPSGPPLVPTTNLQAQPGIAAPYGGLYGSQFNIPSPTGMSIGADGQYRQMSSPMMNSQHQNGQDAPSSVFGYISQVPGIPPSNSLPQQFLTLADVQAMFDLERGKRTLPSLPDPDVKPPYPIEMLSYPYPEGYTVPKFIKFDGKQGNAREHVVRFIETLGIHGSNHVLRLREFSKSLTDRAYSWYVNLAPNSVRSWEEMVNKFHSKFFQVAEKVTTLTLCKEKQQESEDILDYVKRFQDKAVDCHEAVEESYLVQICLEGALSRYKMFLVNHKLPTFSALIEAARNISIPQAQESGFKASYKTSFKSSRGPTVAAASAPDTRNSQGGGHRGQKRKQYNGEKGNVSYPCEIEEVKALVKEWVADGELKLPYVEEMPSKKDRESPEFCVYHRTLKHPTEKCWTLRKIFRDKVEADELRFKKQGTQDIREQPYPQHRDKGKNVAMIAYEGPMIEAIANLDDDDCYLDDILEPEGEQVYYRSALDPEGRTFMTHGEDPFDPEGGEEYYGRGGHHVYVASYFEETEEMVNYESPRVEKDPDHYAKTLQDCVKFKQFFDQLGLSKEARTEITKSIINIAEAHHEGCMSTEGSIPRKAKEQSSAITFSEVDRKYLFSHNRPLYVTAFINGVEFKRAFLDSGASINIMTRATLEKAGISEERIVKQPIVITGFGGERRVTIGCVTVDLAVGEIRSATKFHIIDSETNYHIILGRTWMHRYGAVPSSYHQCVKAKWRKKTVTIQATERPFEIHEAHYSDAIYFTELAVEEVPTTSKPRGVKIPRWEDIKDDKELMAESSKRAMSRPESPPIPRKVMKVREGGKMVYYL
ncbi:unnamed protein product [Camellia sinensis]